MNRVGKTYFAVFVLVALLGPYESLCGQVDEHVMKAVAFEQIARFVEWPEEDRVQKGIEPFIIGVIGENSVSRQVAVLYEKQRIKKRPVRLRHIEVVDDAIPCHLVYVTESGSNELTELVSITKDKPILTITDSEGGTEKGALIRLYVDVKKLRFEINERGFQASGLSIDPFLLKVAKIVNPLGRE